MADNKEINYADMPVSLAEERAVRDQNAALWTPRDALISLLREIDSGEVDVDIVFIAYSRSREDDPTCSQIGYRSAGGNLHTAIGVVEMAKVNALNV